MPKSRRNFLRTSGAALLLASSGGYMLTNSRAARASGLPLQTLSTAQATDLESLAEAIVPGARDAGIAHFIDTQLAASASDSLLMLKYLGIAHQDAPGFYLAGLQSTAKLSQQMFDKPLTALDEKQAASLLAAVTVDETPGWQGAPASFFFFVLRSDACDAVYGTREGFARLDLPYMAHIEPGTPW